MSYLDQFHYQINGQEHFPKLVFLHGLMGFAANWRKIISSLEDQFQVLAFDQRGHGRSIKPKTGYAPEDYAQDLLQIIDDLKWEKIHLVGHSMGGRNALHFASRLPHRVATLTIEDIGPNGDPQDVLRYQTLLGRVPTPFLNKKAAKEFLLNDFGDPVLGNYFYSNLTETPDGLVDWRFSKNGILESVEMGRKKDRWDEVKSLKIPTLLIRGENSTELSKEIYEKMLESNPNIQGQEIPGAGHWAHFDQPEVFSTILKNFLLQHLKS